MLSQVSAVLPRPFRPGDEEEPLAVVRAPLVTEVRGPEQVAPVAATEQPPDPCPADQHASVRR